MIVTKHRQFFSRVGIYCLVLCLCLTLSFHSLANTDVKTRWQNVIQQGKNQDVYFHAWGADAQINAYIQWVAEQVKSRYNINLVHVKLSDTSEAVSRVLAEKSASNHHLGSVDLIWINGANFATMSEHALLLKSWATHLPNFMLTDPNNNPAVNFDFGLPTLGMEAPWGQASLTFYYDSLAIAGSGDNKLPTTLKQLLHWSENNPGRFSYPKPPDFLGMSFLKTALVILLQQDKNLQAQLTQAANENNIEQVLNSLWEFLDKLHPTLWRQGKHFMQSGAQMRRLVDDTELSLAFTFSGPEVPAAVKRFDLPKSIRSFAMHDGSLTNTHFIAIPYNASHSYGAQVVANFLLSPQAQAKKQNPDIWGDKTVLSQDMLSAEQKALFNDMAQHVSALPLNAIKKTLSEPHPSWVNAIIKGWQRRYGISQ